MDKIERRLGGEWDEYCVYTREEADELGLDYVDWREAEPGDWALTDDDYVGECVRSRTYEGKHGRIRDFKTFTFARAWATESEHLSYEARKEKEAWAYSSATTWDEIEARRPRVHNTAEALVQMMISDEKVDWDLLGKIYRPDEKVPAATVKKLVRSEKIRNVIREKLREVLVDKDIKEGDVIDKFERAYEKAEEKGQPNAMIRVAENYRDMLDMSPDKEEHTQELEWDVSSDDLLDDSDNEPDTLTARERRTKELASGEVEDDEGGDQESAEEGD